MTLHQGQGQRHEHEHIYHAYVYRHAKFECHSLNTACDMAVKGMAVIVQVKHVVKFETT